MRYALGVLLLCLASEASGQTVNVAARLDAALRAAGVPIEGVSLGTIADKATWKVSPPTLQEMAQPIIDAFDPTAASVIAAELDREARVIPRHVRALVLFYLRDKLGRNPSAAERQAAIEALVQAYKDVSP